MKGVYSFVNIALVVRDLSRHPRGALLADDLLHAMTFDDTSLAVLDRAPSDASNGATRETLLHVTGQESRALDVLAAARQVSEVAGLAAWTSSLPVLAVAPMGGCAELLAWLRNEVLDAGWVCAGDVSVCAWPRAFDVVCDGVLVSYAGADDAESAALARPWRRWTRQRSTQLSPTQVPAAVDDPAVAQIVALVRSSDPQGLAAAGRALQAARAEGWSWAAAMHEACWAVELTGRGRAAAVAQLDALAALLMVAGAPPPPDVVAAVTAAVHATFVADVLASDVLAAMCRPLLAHAG
ncbi:MAG: hypothetical protein QOJ03_3152 [Frankiaceae bacterium]|nr:hypothetical protein [Frankiaceae bacterium]